MTDFNFEDHSHRRYNPFTGDWLQVSPHRGKRPWQGQEEDTAEAQKPAYDEKCYLCPGNTRINGEKNPDYTGAYVFQNDFGAFFPLLKGPKNSKTVYPLRRTPPP